MEAQPAPAIEPRDDVERRVLASYRFADVHHATAKRILHRLRVAEWDRATPWATEDIVL